MRKDIEEAWEEKRVLIRRKHKAESGEKIHYYVPKGYEYFGDTGKKIKENDRIEDVNCLVPNVEFDKKSDKWALNFMGADSGGYDAQAFVYYFNNLDDILIFMGFPLACSCIK